MVHVYQIIIFSAAVMCANTFAIQGMEPYETAPIILNNGNHNKCPLNNDKQRLIKMSQDTILKTLLIHDSESLLNVCGPGYWRRVFYFNASSNIDQRCPGNWNTIASPVRGCAGSSRACRSAFSDDINITYSKVCGRIIGGGRGLPDAFYRHARNQYYTIQHNYLDGVSITHGASGSQTHIWSLAVGHSAAVSFTTRCPCDYSTLQNHTKAPFPPVEVGNNYFCERSNSLNFDQLWTGESCTSNNPCCSFHNPPYFSVQLPAATTDRIELPESVMMNMNMMKTYWCCLLKFMYSHSYCIA